MKVLKIIAIVLLTIAIALVPYSAYPNLNKQTGNSVQSRGTGGGAPQVRKTITDVSPVYITAILSSMKADKLHNPPLSRNTPKIKTVVDSFVFTSEVIKGKITTTASDIDNPDIIIKTDKQTFLKIVNSNSPIATLQQEVNIGTMQVELVAGKTELFVKGYLTLYKEITGEDA